MRKSFWQTASPVGFAIGHCPPNTSWLVPRRRETVKLWKFPLPGKISK
jgi:hypothetical protein